MTDARHTITYLIREGRFYYAGDHWDENVRKACLYTTPARASAILHSNLSRHKNAIIVCVIQNKSFDYFDGERFVYELGGARFYTPEEASQALLTI